MAEVKLNTPLYRVDIVEYERGWGSKIDETKYFDNKEEAERYAKAYNQKHNTSPTVPDWYMVAQYVGKIS